MSAFLLFFSFSVVFASNQLDFKVVKLENEQYCPKWFMDHLDASAEDADLVQGGVTLHGVFLDKNEKINFVGAPLSCPNNEEIIFNQWGNRKVQINHEKIFFLNSRNPLNTLFDRALYCKSKNEFEVWSWDKNDGPLQVITTNNTIMLYSKDNYLHKIALGYSTDDTFRSSFAFRIISSFDEYRFKYDACDNAFVAHYLCKLTSSYFSKGSQMTYFCSANLVLDKSTNTISRLVRDGNKDDSKIIGLIPLCSLQEFNDVLKQINDSNDQKKSLDGCVALFEGNTFYIRLKLLFMWYAIKIKHYLVCVYQRCTLKNNKTI